MTTSRNDLSAVCEALRGRKHWPDKERTARLDVYTRSLVERFKAIRYASDQIRRNQEFKVIQFAPGEGSGTRPVVGLPAGTTQTIADNEERVWFYANAFWAFAYSLFDVLANVINVVHPVVADETKVSFTQAAEGYRELGPKNRGAKEKLPTNLMKRLDAVVGHRTFQGLAEYRQCCLHRREVCLHRTTITQNVSRPYAGTTAIDEPETVFLVCDDPNAISPVFKSQRQLLVECEAVSTFVRKEIIAILKKL